ncbi:hypothetical protein [Ideonella sp.]|uniref:hypothetical protein n=1 Tax=Ideonella sp. TaxID=1929293 RepID=UPI0037BF8413
MPSLPTLGSIATSWGRRAFPASRPPTMTVVPWMGLAVLVGLLLPASADAQISVLIKLAPPPLLVYAQPQVPGDDYIWTPGYWTWSAEQNAYFWVPGTWVMAPNKGYLWTPGYWAFERVGYRWHSGYWGVRIGFYGGINYGFGYHGSGYDGGRWDRGVFRYNRAVSNVNRQTVHLTYNAPVMVHKQVTRVSFNGGREGTAARPTVSERRLQAAEHTAPRAEQVQHETAARGMVTQRHTGAHEAPQVAATPKPSEFVASAVERVRPAPDVRPKHDRAKPDKATPVQAAASAPHRPDKKASEAHPEKPRREDPPRKDR